MKPIDTDQPNPPTRRTYEPVPPPRVQLPDSLGLPRSLRGLTPQIGPSTTLTPRQVKAAPGLL